MTNTTAIAAPVAATILAQRNARRGAAASAEAHAAVTLLDAALVARIRRDDLATLRARAERSRLDRIDVAARAYAAISA
jgi:hypothetical protein